jgi:anti-sigma factor RsiW
LVTCKDFLRELNEYLDDSAQPDVKKELQAHLDECPNCWVICDTTKKTIAIYRGMEPYSISQTAHDRLIKALQRRGQLVPRP